MKNSDNNGRHLGLAIYVGFCILMCTEMFCEGLKTKMRLGKISILVCTGFSTIISDGMIHNNI